MGVGKTTMRHQSTDERRMIGYLLDELSAEDRARLEEAYLADDRLYEELKAIETELIDAYAAGKLTGSDKQHFEARYLASKEQRERIAFARRLAEHIARSTPAPAPAPTAAPWWRRSRAGSWWPQRALSAASAALALFALGSLAWWASESASRQSQELARQGPPAASSGERPGVAPSGSAQAQAQPPAIGSPADSLVALVLVPGSLRSPEGGAFLTVPGNAAFVWIRIEHEGESLAAYRVVLRTPEGQTVWTQSELKPYRPGASSVIVAVPASVLRPGDYILTLGGGPAGSGLPAADVGAYSFTVVGP